VPAEHAVSEQYLDPRGSMARPTDGSAVDLGAFEAVGPGGGGGDDVDNPPPDPDPEPPDPGVEEPMEGDKEGGCGCRSAGERGSRWPLALAFGGLALLVLRRRR
jgi:MYXO-CTERM domain-containing protein